MLLVDGDTLFLLDLSFDASDRIGWINFEIYGPSRFSLDKNLHGFTKSEDQGGSIFDIVMRESFAIFKSFLIEEKFLLTEWDPLLDLDLCFDSHYDVRWFNSELDFLTIIGLNEYLHWCSLYLLEHKGRFVLDAIII